MDPGVQISVPAPAPVGVLIACARVQICGITCCGRSNFEQHCACKKHLRKAAIAAAAAAAADGTGGPIFEAGTYSESESQTQAPLAGLQEQCRSYCKQVRLCLDRQPHCLFPQASRRRAYCKSSLCNNAWNLVHVCQLNYAWPCCDPCYRSSCHFTRRCVRMVEPLIARGSFAENGDLFCLTSCVRMTQSHHIHARAQCKTRCACARR